MLGRPRKTESTVGKRFGRVIVIAEVRAGGSERGRTMAECLCECGQTFSTIIYRLTSGHTQSCGCYKRDRLRETQRTHGASDTPLYRRWWAMIHRCHNSNVAKYKSYGGRGIFVCERWHASFEAFVADMGEPPSPKHSLDRIDNDRGYHCGRCADCERREAAPNCRWATATEQMLNRRTTQMLTFRGRTMPAALWAPEVGIEARMILERIRKGWSVEKALTEPVRYASRPKDADGRIIPDPCTVAGCSRGVRAKGLCASHYRRLFAPSQPKDARRSVTP